MLLPGFSTQNTFMAVVFFSFSRTSSHTIIYNKKSANILSMPFFKCFDSEKRCPEQILNW